LSDITITKINHAEIAIKTFDVNIYEGIKNHFSFITDKYWFSPKYKQGIWDGKITLFKQGKLPIGFTPRLLDFITKNNYSYTIDFLIERKINEDKLLEFLDTVPFPWEPHDFQIEAFFDAIKKRNICIISKTGTGKSAIIHFINFFMNYLNKKTLLIVSELGLIKQMESDLISYGYDGDNLKCISGGVEKSFGEYPLIISTWQSIHRLSEEELDKFDCVIVDEVHKAKVNSKIIAEILSKLKKAEYRIGTTGTLPQNKNIDYYSAVGYIGEPVFYRTYEELKEAKILADMMVYSVILRYPHSERVMAADEFSRNYHDEIDYLMKSDRRNEYLVNTIKENCGTQNTLVLFQYIEKHGKVLLDLFKQRFPDKKILYIDGGVDIDIREQSRFVAEKEDNLIILASYGTFSTGINIKNIHHIFLAHSTKSFIRVIQTIGRGLRMHEKKDRLTVWDINDDLCLSEKHYTNYIMKHHKERLHIYETEGYPVEIKEVNLL